MLQATNYFLHTAPGLPPQAWWLPALVLFILGLAAVIDSFTSTIPDPLMFFGAVAVTGLQGVFVSWPFAAHHLMIAIAAAFALWALNQIWLFLFKHDAIGMGDAKWTMLTVACFGVLPAVFAWGVGACLAVLWMGLLRVVRYEISRVHFAPFLFIGLIAGLYWIGLQP